MSKRRKLIIAGVTSLVIVLIGAALVVYARNRSIHREVSQEYSQITIPAILEQKQNNATYLQKGLGRKPIRVYVYQYKVEHSQVHQAIRTSLEQAGYDVSGETDSNQIDGWNDKLRVTAVIHDQDKSNKGGIVSVVAEPQK